MLERWKTIPGYTGLYQVSDLGRVKSLAGYRQNRVQCRFHKEKLLKLRGGRPSSPYFSVNLWNRSGQMKERSVHLLVLEVFVGPKPAFGYQGNHKDGCKTNNEARNLEWVTSLGNIMHSRVVLKNKGKKLTHFEVEEIKKVLAIPSRKYGRYSPLAKRYGVTVSIIALIDQGRLWAHV
jgi:hypothetical protein